MINLHLHYQYNDWQCFQCCRRLRHHSFHHLTVHLPRCLVQYNPPDYWSLELDHALACNRNMTPFSERVFFQQTLLLHQMNLNEKNKWNERKQCDWSLQNKHITKLFVDMCYVRCINLSIYVKQWLWSEVCNHIFIFRNENLALLTNNWIFNPILL